MYQARVHSTSHWLTVNHLKYHVRIWNDSAPQSFLFLHGHEDCAATFQFVVDHLPNDWRIIAPDWRGHGQSQWSHDSYMMQNYISDLDQIIDHYFPDQRVNILGHSMGGNALGLYAGVRPERMDRLIVLDAFGLSDEEVSVLPDKIGQWLDGLRGRPPKRPSPDVHDFSQRLRAANRRLDEDKALFLAQALTLVREDGQVEAAFDPLHRGPRPFTYRFEDVAACFTRISAPMLWVSSGRRLNAALANGGLEARRQLLRNCKHVNLPETGHNLHHDAPKAIAALARAFYAGEPLPDPLPHD